MTIGQLTLQDPESVSVIYKINGYIHESAFGDLSKFVKNYRKVYTLTIDGIVDDDIDDIRDEIQNGAVDLVLSALSIDTQALIVMSEENMPYGGDEYRRVFKLICEDQTAYSIGGAVSTDLTEGIKINEIYHPEPHDIQIIQEVQNVDYDCQDGINTRDKMFSRDKISVSWNNLPNAVIKDIVDNIMSSIYHNVTHPLFDATSVIDISREEYSNYGVGNLGLTITSIAATI